MGIVTVITSGKGGVGKSTVSAGLSMELARNGESVLLIDGDFGLRSLDLILGIKEKLVYDVSDVIDGSCEITDAIYGCPFVDNLYVIPASLDVEDMLDRDTMRKFIKVIAKYYDHVIIDCPAGVGDGFKSCVVSADRAVVVANTNPISLSDSRIVKDILIKNGIEDVRLVINRFSNTDFKKSSLYRDLDQVIDESCIQLIAIIPEDDCVLKSFSKGLPLGEKSPARKAFERFALRLLGNNVSLPSCKKL